MISTISNSTNNGTRTRMMRNTHGMLQTATASHHDRRHSSSSRFVVRSPRQIRQKKPYPSGQWKTPTKRLHSRYQVDILASIIEVEEDHHQHQGAGGSGVVKIIMSSTSFLNKSSLKNRMTTTTTTKRMRKNQESDGACIPSGTRGTARKSRVFRTLISRIRHR